jgi:hypothetical protein
MTFSMIFADKLYRRQWLTLSACAILETCVGEAIAQESAFGNSGQEPASPNELKSVPEVDSPQYSKWQTENWRFGFSLTSGSGKGLATFTIPRDWPEQKVRILDQQVSPLITKFESRDSQGLARQIVVRMDRLPRAANVQAVCLMEIQKAQINSVSDMSDWVVPAKLDKELKHYLQSSPYIDPGHAKIKRAATELAEENPGWEQVEKIYDWVREKVKYREGEIKTAVKALEDGSGDCEELTSVFVAVCRASRIPARMVWVPGHCYPEFYLEKKSRPGKGAWFPCQIAGTRMFGSMEEARPILQKGDRFKVPEKTEVVRYLSEYAKIDALTGTTKPKLSFISEKVN